MKYIIQLIILVMAFILSACSSIPKDYKGNPLVKFNDQVKFYYKSKQTGFFLFIVMDTKFNSRITDGVKIVEKNEGLSIGCNNIFWEIAEMIATEEKWSILKEATLVQTNIETNYCAVSGHIQTLPSSLSTNKWNSCKKDEDCTLYHNHCGAPKGLNKSFLPEYKDYIDAITKVIHCNNFVAGNWPLNMESVGVKCKREHCEAMLNNSKSKKKLKHQ